MTSNATESKDVAWLKRWQILVPFGVLIMIVLALVVVPLTAGLNPDGSLGVGDGVVGAGTLLLGVVTLASVLLNWRSLRDSKAQAREAVEASYRPVVVPDIDDTRTIAVPARYGVPLDTPDAFANDNPEAKPWTMPTRPTAFPENLLIPIHNMGVGPALRVVIRIFPEEEANVFAWDGIHDTLFATVPWLGAGDWRVCRTCPSYTGPCLRIARRACWARSAYQAAKKEHELAWSKIGSR